MGELAFAWGTPVGGVRDRAISLYPTVSFFWFEVSNQATTSFRSIECVVIREAGTPSTISQ